MSYGLLFEVLLFARFESECGLFLNYRFLSAESVKMYFLCKATKFLGCFCVAILSAMTVLPGFPFMAEQFDVLLIGKLLN